MMSRMFHDWCLINIIRVVTSAVPCHTVNLSTNLRRALYLCHPLLEQKQVEVSEHFAGGERPLQCVVVPLDHRQATFAGLLLVQQVLKEKTRTSHALVDGAAEKPAIVIQLRFIF